MGVSETATGFAPESISIADLVWLVAELNCLFPAVYSLIYASTVAQNTGKRLESYHGLILRVFVETFDAATVYCPPLEP